jgi:hypothetical protein
MVAQMLLLLVISFGTNNWEKQVSVVIYGLVFNFAHQIQSLLPHPYMLLIAKNVYVFNYGGAKAIDAKDRIFTSSPTEP